MKPKSPLLRVGVDALLLAALGVNVLFGADPALVGAQERAFFGGSVYARVTTCGLGTGGAFSSSDADETLGFSITGCSILCWSGVDSIEVDIAEEAPFPDERVASSIVTDKFATEEASFPDEGFVASAPDEVFATALVDAV